MRKRTVVIILSLLCFAGTAQAANTGFLPAIYSILFGGGYKLTVEISGNGTVTSSPAGINCGTDCTESYPKAAAQEVTLTASPSSDSFFYGWDDDVCTGTAPCTVTMDQSRTVKALFKTNPGIPVNVEEENNDTAALANLILLDTTITGEIESRGASDYFKFTASGGKTITVNIDSDYAVESGRYVVIELRDENDVLINVFTVTKGDTFNIDVPASGSTFYLVVKGTGSDPTYIDVEYKLTAYSNDGGSPDPAESEANDDLAGADTLAFNETIHGSLKAIDDLDWYKVTNSGGLTHTTMQFGSTVSDVNWVVTIYPSVGTAGTPLARIAVKDGSELNVDLPLNDAYYFVVSDFRNVTGDTNYSNAPYTLTVTKNTSSTVVAESESNGTVGTADLVDFSTYTSLSGQCQLTNTAGQQQTATDIDWYRYSVVNGQTYNFTFTTTAVGSNWKITVYNGNGSSTTWYPSTTANQTYSLVANATGNAYFKIEGGTEYGNSSVMYTITKQ